ncbi:MAG TPA: exopolysaccharide biosynthesis polyprenyl glycosylphosphotransferase [Rhodopila sp.]|uniref:exopolysaccharide biosynthesis polyprenyl glycosylphosphotransferase n=1 Tax=Rhodopila sp. TaxID=2480087 RepID=UPI002CA3D64F|nr:exopolysaccharide biosynthesis polyprenyl glycosylphosphotransferase [Rhodopila sp.]HVY15003.1 exopolysaccharide biosynthesis polyprenyl glycosylphosphotransferase [Rhodopila sp.]
MVLSTLATIGLDALSAALAAAGCYALFNPLSDFTLSSVIVPLALLVLSVNVSFLERGLYTGTEIVSNRLNGRRVALAWVQAVALGTLLTFCLATFASASDLRTTFADMTRILRGPWLPLFLVVGFLSVLGARKVRVSAIRVRIALNRSVIIGDPRSIDDLVRRLRTGADGAAFDIVGVVELDSVDPEARNARLDTLERMIQEDTIETVLVALPWTATEELRQIVHRISLSPVNIYVYPGMHTLKLLPDVDTRRNDVPLLMVCHRPMEGWRAAVKRLEDIAVSGLLLAFISPVMVVIACAIKLTSKGPVFFRQRRLGYNNRVIEVLKFRSMYTHLSDADASVQTLRGDKRVTSVGALLRRSSLDELPQLINVLRGDMSLVGPRPHALATTAGGVALHDAVPVYAARHRVKPGITGWAQVNGYRGALDSVEKIVHRVDHDLYYIENWSLGFDLKILFQTVCLVFADDNAF